MYLIRLHVVCGRCFFAVSLGHRRPGFRLFAEMDVTLSLSLSCFFFPPQSSRQCCLRSVVNKSPQWLCCRCCQASVWPQCVHVAIQLGVFIVCVVVLVRQHRRATGPFGVQLLAEASALRKAITGIQSGFFCDTWLSEVLIIVFLSSNVAAPSQLPINQPTGTTVRDNDGRRCSRAPPCHVGCFYTLHQFYSCHHTAVLNRKQPFVIVHYFYNVKRLRSAFFVWYFFNQRQGFEGVAEVLVLNVLSVVLHCRLLSFLSDLQEETSVSLHASRMRKKAATSPKGKGATMGCLLLLASRGRQQSA